MARHDKSWVTRYQLHRWGLAAVLLLTMTGARLVFLPPPPRPDAYFQKVAAAATATPASFGPWVSIDSPVPPAAITMLRPNVAVSREYTNLQTGQRATLLLVQCGDARDMQGHYPPVCYVNNGYRSVAARPRDWQLDGLSIQATEYTFSSTRPDDLRSMIIYDFMILPNGRTCRDMSGIETIARNPRKHQLGAAQLQVLVDPSIPEAQRDALFRTLVQAHRRTLDAILAGDP
jgi:hypothetical protein